MNFSYLQDLNELMFPSTAKDKLGEGQPVPTESPSEVLPGNISQKQKESQPSKQDSSFGPAKPAVAKRNGPISFTLEEPIVSKTVIVPSGPRRYLYFQSSPHNLNTISCFNTMNDVRFLCHIPDAQ